MTEFLVKCDHPAVSRAGDDTVLDDSGTKTALLRDAG